MKLRILLSEDHNIIRAGIRNLIQEEQDMEVVAEARNGLEAVRLAGEKSPDVMITKIHLPHLDGIEATRRIVGTNPSVRVLALSACTDLQCVLSMLQAGAKGYLTKSCCFEEVVRAVRRIASGAIYLSPEMYPSVLEQCLKLPSSADGIKGALTAREKDVLKLMAEGRTTKEIAANLEVSVKTVETHRSNIMKKTNVHCIAGLVKYAVRMGICIP